MVKQTETPGEPVKFKVIVSAISITGEHWEGVNPPRIPGWVEVEN
jgi:hypothetical protein